MTLTSHLSCMPHSFAARTGSRLAAVQALFQIEQTNETSSTVLREFLEYRLQPNEEKKLDQEDYIPMGSEVDLSFFTTLVRGTMENKPIIDEMVTACLTPGWSFGRIESVLRAILRAATYELKELTSIPIPVIINEYVEIAKAFYDSKEISFVNGVLDRLAKKLREGTVDEI